jgi:hypothetical protein
MRSPGRSTFTANRAAKELGWKPRFTAQHILDYADEEVDWILKHKDWKSQA